MPTWNNEERRDRDEVEVQFASRVITEMRATSESIKALSVQMEAMTRSLAAAKDEFAKVSTVAGIDTRVLVLEDKAKEDQAVDKFKTKLRTSIYGGSIIGGLLLALQLYGLLRGQ